MTRLPQPGQDAGQWGDILNDFLSQSHKENGTLKDNIVTSINIAPGAVTKSTIGLSNVDNTSDINKPVSTAQQAALDSKANTTELADKISTADLDTETANRITTSGTAVQLALSSSYATAAQGAKADSAVQPDVLDDAIDSLSSVYATAAQGAKADSAVQPDVLDDAIDSLSSVYATAAQGAKADSAVQPETLAAAMIGAPAWWAGTQTAYDAMPSKDPNVLYLITGT